ncbi:hypothetical protein Ancab_022431 [Ancistrocladus abbreviatus]
MVRSGQVQERIQSACIIMDSRSTESDGSGSGVGVRAQPNFKAHGTALFYSNDAVLRYSRHGAGITAKNFQAPAKKGEIRKFEGQDNGHAGQQAASVASVKIVSETNL